MRIKKYLTEYKNYKEKSMSDLPFFRTLSKDEKDMLILSLRRSKEPTGVFPEMDTLPYFKAEFTLSCLIAAQKILNEKGLEIAHKLIDKFEAEDIV